MENDIINIKLKRYIYYLNKIGLASEEDNFQINKIFFQLGKLYINTNAILSSNFDFIQKYFKENITKTITLFLNSLTSEKNNKISLNLYQKFTEKEKLLEIEKAYTIDKLFRTLKLKRAFKKIYFFSKNNHNYNFLYNISPNISNNAFDYSPNLKKIPNYTRNSDENNRNRLSNIGRLIESSSQIINTQGDNKTISKISDLGINCSFTNEYSPFIKYNDFNEKDNLEKRINYASHKQNLFPVNFSNNQLFNKRSNLKQLKLTPHFEYLENIKQSIKSQEISKENNISTYSHEQEETKKYGLKRKINKVKKTPILNINTNKINNFKRIEKLYLDNQRKFDKRTEGILLRDSRLSRENTFQPKFVSISVKKLKNNFSIRMRKFNKIKEEKKKKLMKSIETDYNSIYTFSPKLNKSHNNQKNNNINKNKKISAYERLYNKNKNLKRKSEGVINDNNKSSPLNNKSVDFQKIQKLYEEYKLLKQKRNKKQQIIDQERGLTFNPLLINGNKYMNKITPGFLEREKKFVEEHKNHMNAYRNFLNKEKEKYFKRYSEDKKIIVKNVVNRLYNEQINKKIKNSNHRIKTENNKETENFDGKESIILTKSNKSYESLNKNKDNKLRSELNNNEIKISIKSSGNFSLSQLINDKNN